MSATTTTRAWTEAMGGEADSRRLISPTMLFDEFLAREITTVPCALAGLGKMLGGGFQTSQDTVVTAPAGHGKTAFVVQNVAYAVLNGDFCGVLALKDGDQWADGLRLAQMAGVDRFQLRDRVPEAVEAARAAMARYDERLMFYDVMKPGATFLDMAEQGRRWAGDRGHLFIGSDSIHVLAVADQAKERAMPIYDRMAVRFEIVHDFMVENDAAGLTVAQSSRAAYRNKREEENVDLLASISGGHVAENTIDVLIVLTKPNENGTRFLVIPKSRLGGQGARVPVRFDEERSLWFDVEPVAEESVPRETKAKAKQAVKGENDRKAKDDIAALIRNAGSAGKTFGELQGAFHRGRPWLASVLGELAAAGLIHQGKAVRVNKRKQDRLEDVWLWS